jgi:hypothetical protein
VSYINDHHGCVERIPDYDDESDLIGWASFPRSRWPLGATRRRPQLSLPDLQARERADSRRRAARLSVCSLRRCRGRVLNL